MLLEEITEMNYIYVVFISTNTVMGKGIRLFTRNKYSHVTIAVDRKLSTMYSFARYHINSPIYGGFVTERPGRYLYSDRDVLVKICEVPIEPQEYERILGEIEYFQRNREVMIYNTVNALLSLLGKRLTAKDMYTCLEFATHLLGYPNMNAIRELERRLEGQIVYTGSLRGTAAWEQEPSGEDEFFRRRRVIGIAYDTVYHVRKVVGRVLHA
ncbi:MAG: hypothetical protein K0R46_1290 [Herbinix sp.]|jgi:hypothetical protein|nr:hypothetical protein [Herbinix sp.]